MIQQTINIKPLSVNDCWQGRRFKTKEYKAYEKEMKLMIKKQKMPVAPYNIEPGTTSLTQAQMKAIGVELGVIEDKELTSSLKATGEGHERMKTGGA